MKFKLVITPAINPRFRHAIEAVLEEFGYDVHGGGTCIVPDLSHCDITFSGPHPLDLNKPGAGVLDRWWEDGSGDAPKAKQAADNCHCVECPEDCYRSGMADDDLPDDEAEIISTPEGRNPYYDLTKASTAKEATDDGT